MIEAIEKIPLKILEGQLEMEEDESSKTNPEYIVILLDREFNINKIDEGTFNEICEKYKNLSDLQKKLIKNFNYYLGVDYAFDKYGNKGYGGQSGLYTCSLLHYNFAIETFQSIIKERKRTKIDKTINALKKDKFIPLEIKKLLLKLINNFFINIILDRKESRYNLDFSDKNSCKIIFIPSEENFIKKYNEFEEDYLFDKFRKNVCIEKDGIKKYKFPIDFHETPQTQPLATLYSKFGKSETIFQDEWCNLFSEKDFEKLNLFRRIMKKRKILPLPLFKVSKESNVYETCFSKENSLLKKLEKIYSKNKEPFDYCLISNFNGYSFENIINYSFNISDSINKEIYDLNFNKYFDKKEKRIKEFHPIEIMHNKSELLWDFSFLFWHVDKEQSQQKQMSFFNPSDKIFKNNSYLKQLFLENAESIINQIFKQDDTFINYQLQILVNKLLNGILKTKELKKRYSKSFGDINKTLLIALKYEKIKKDKKTMVIITKDIENKLEKFQKDSENENVKLKFEEIKNDFEAYYCAGQIIYYLLSKTSSSHSVLDLMSKHLISVNNTEQLKNKICKLSDRYSHDIYNNKKWGILNESFLKYKFQDEKVKMNLIPLFIGFYANNIFFNKSKSLKDGEDDKDEGAK